MDKEYNSILHTGLKWNTFAIFVTSKDRKT